MSSANESPHDIGATDAKPKSGRKGLMSGFKRLGKSKTLLNLNSFDLRGNTDGTGFTDGGDEDNSSFQAIGYENATELPEPIQVRHLPERRESTVSQHRGSIESPGSPDVGSHTETIFKQPQMSLIDAHTVFSSGSSFNESFSSLDPKSRQTSGGDADLSEHGSTVDSGHRAEVRKVNRIESKLGLNPRKLDAVPPEPSNLASIGLTLAGYGLSEDLSHPLASQTLTKAPTFPNNYSMSSLPEKDSERSTPAQSLKHSTTLSALNTRVKPSSTSQSAPNTPVLSHSVQAFTAVSLHMHSIPDPEVVDQLFERLLSIRAFPGKALKTLREQPTKRKWELLLREHETNATFDLKTLTKQAIHRVSNNIIDKRNVDNDQETSSSSTAHIPKTYVKQISSSVAKFTGKDSRSKSFDSTENDISNTNEMFRKKQKPKDGSPEWFVSKIIENKLSLKEFKKLEKKLIENHFQVKPGTFWVQAFNDAQGETALSVVLSRINKKSIKSNEEVEKEYVIVKCLKHIINCERLEIQDMELKKYISQVNKTQIIKSIVGSIISPRIATRKLVTELLIFLSYYEDNEYLPCILNELECLQDLVGAYVRFQPWLSCLESSLNKHPSSGDIFGNDSSFHDYALTSLLLINSLIEGSSSIKKRITLREELKDSGITEIFIKLHALNNARLDEEIEKYEEYEEEDLDDYHEFSRTDASLSYSATFAPDPIPPQHTSNLTEEEYKLKSTLRNLLSLHANEKSPEEIDEQASQVESIVKQIISGTSAGIDPGTALNSSIQRFTDRLSTDDTAKRAVLEVRDLEERIKELELQNQRLSIEAGYGVNENISNLQRELALRDKKLSDQENQIRFMNDRIRLLEKDKPSRSINEFDFQSDSNTRRNTRFSGGPISIGKDGFIEELEDVLQKSPSRHRNQESSLKISNVSKSQNVSGGTSQTGKYSGSSRGDKSILSKSRPERIRINAIPISEITSKRWAKENNNNEKSFGNNESLDSNPDIHDTNSEVDTRIDMKQSHPIHRSISDFDFEFRGDENSVFKHEKDQTQGQHMEANTVSKQLFKHQESQMNSHTTDVKPGSSAAVLPPPAPPAPPPAPPSLPEFMKTNVNNSSLTSPSAPPSAPPPPPALPEFMSKTVNAPPPPPPPPMLPDFMKTDTSPGVPPPPPALPGFMQNSSNEVPPIAKRILDEGSDSKPPTPPPMPGILSGISSIINSPIESKIGTPTKETPPVDVQPLDSAIQSVSTKPKPKLKQMHWDKIDNIEKTFWTGIEPDKLSDRLMEKGILREVEKVFVAKYSAIKMKSNVADKSIEQEKVSYLPRDLAQQFGINLHIFSHLSPTELTLKILHCDEEILTNISVLEFFNNDVLSEISDSTLRNFKPYSTDFSNSIDLKKETKKDPDLLERPDRIYLELCFNLRHYWKSRSRALLLTQTYQKDYLDLVKKLELIDDANKSLRNTENLQNVLGLIRSVGNFMNDHSKQALGFKLDTLSRLKFMKDEKNSMNFLHYIERIVRNEFPEFGSFVDELSPLQLIQNISIEQLESDCQEYERNINNVLSSISKGNLSDVKNFHPEDKVLAKLTKPMERAQTKNSLLQSHWNRTNEEFTSLMEYFGENPDDGQSKNQFFKKIIGFINEFKRAHVENIQREEEQRAYEVRKRLAEESKMASKKGSKTNNQKDEDVQQTDYSQDGSTREKSNCTEDNENNRLSKGSDAIDLLLEKLKSSTPSTTSSTSREMRRKRRSQVLSMYSAKDAGPDLFGEIDASEVQTALTTQYESVNLLKRRLTSRKNQVVNEVTPKNDQVYLRAQAMLHQLRKESDGRDNGVPTDILEEEDEKEHEGRADQLDQQIGGIDVNDHNIFEKTPTVKDDNSLVEIIEVRESSTETEPIEVENEPIEVEHGPTSNS